jgi:hypothetical protein
MSKEQKLMTKNKTQKKWKVNYKLKTTNYKLALSLRTYGKEAVSGISYIGLQIELF